MKISEFKNEDALELLVEIIEPTTEILSDPKIQRVFNGGKVNKMDIVKKLLKDHKKSIVQIMAALNGKSYEEYEFNILTGTKQLLEMMDDEELVSFFQSQGQMNQGASSGPATENTEATETV